MKTLIKSGQSLTQSEKDEVKDELNKAKFHIIRARKIIDAKQIVSLTLCAGFAKTDIALKRNN